MPGTSLSASKRVMVPDRQVSWLRIVVAGLLPKATASVDLVHDSPVTVTGSRRIRTGFPFQLSSSHLSAFLVVEAPGRHHLPQKVTAIIGCRGEMKRRPNPGGVAIGGFDDQATRDCSK